MQYILDNLDKGRYMVVVTVDLKKAFDTVDHQILITKNMERIGVRDIANEVIKSDLEKRRVKAVLNN